MNITTQTVLLTGASSGIGLEMAELLAARGFDLVLVSRSAGKLEQLAARLRGEHHVAVHVCAVDLSLPGAAARVAEFTRERGLRVDMLVNNAGVGLYGEHHELERGELAAMLQLNVTALAELCQIYGHEMRARGRGRILNVASTAAYQPAPYLAAYGASKSFVLNFSEAIAKELEGSGVTVSCLSPGPTDTGFFSGMDRAGVHNGHFDRADRVDARGVARLGVDMMLRGELSRIVGLMNYLRAWSLRFASRAMVARISKNLLRPRALLLAAGRSA